MMPKKKRIQRKEFPSGKRGTSFFHPLFTIRITPQKNKKQDTKYSVVVSKKVEKSAVGRNTVKRKGYTALKALETYIPQGWYVVFYPKKELNNHKSVHIAQEIKKSTKSFL